MHWMKLIGVVEAEYRRWRHSDGGINRWASRPFRTDAAT